MKFLRDSLPGTLLVGLSSDVGITLYLYDQSWVSLRRSWVSLSPQQHKSSNDRQHFKRLLPLFVVSNNVSHNDGTPRLDCVVLTSDGMLLTVYYDYDVKVHAVREV